MRRLAKIFQGKIQASNEPSCWPRIAPRGPTTVKGFEGTASRMTLRGTLFSNGKLAKSGGWLLAWPMVRGTAVTLKNKNTATARRAESGQDPRIPSLIGINDSKNLGRARSFPLGFIP